MYNLIFIPEANDDVLQTYEWYEKQRVGLGETFLLQLDVQVTRILKNPFEFVIVRKTVRKALLNQFPYQVYFKLSVETIFIIAVLHNSRRPGLWKKRV